MKHWFTRSPRLLLLVAVVFAVGLVAAACGEGAEEGEQEEGNGEAPEAEGNGIVAGLNQEPDILNAFIVGGDLAVTSQVTDGILESPLQVTPDLEDLDTAYQPELAEEQPEVVSEDPLTIEYTLQEGITFSDGEPLTSEDARFTYDQIMDEDNEIISREGWELIEEFETPDEQTVRMTFSEPYAPWRSLLVSSPGSPGIIPEHIYGEDDVDFNSDLNEEIIGSGPFVLDEWNRGQSLTVTANEDYWGEEPGLDEVVYRFVPDSQTLVNELEAGSIDFIEPQLDIGLIPRLEDFDGTEVQTGAGTQWEHIGFQLDEVDSLPLRQAVAYGIDRQQIIDEVLEGEAVTLDSPIVPDQEQFYNPAWEQYSFDQDQARQLVEEAEAEGADTSIEFSTTAGEALRETLQEVVQDQLGEVGIDVTINNSAADTYFGERTPAGDFEAGQWAWLADPDPDYVNLFTIDAIEEGQNYYRYRNEEVSELWEQASVTVDEDERAELIIEAQELMAEDVPIIPLYQRTVIYAYDESLEGPEMNPTIAGPFWNMEEWTIAE
ncbi:MAG: peptide ABC transporter substrate-binding protein [Rubrobacter sp.]|nr:peptide ABC transporter substrate-binding protein [Rubrobacter sp.]